MKLAARVVSLFVLASCFTILPNRSSAQTPAVAQRVTTAIDNQNLTTLHGNVHPLAKAEFDQGAAADAQALHRMLLLLKRSPEQDAALQQLLGDQQNKSSGRYQSWLTPAQFGAQFGPSDADIQTITQWLESQGFSGVVVGAGRTTIEFSGNAGQVRNAFHTEIRRYAVKGVTHLANTSDPAIPAALAPVIAGIVSLNDFPITPDLKRLGTFQKSLKTGETRPLFTFVGCAGTCYGVGPADFAKIYNTQPLLSGSPSIDGTGQGIAIVGESNINVQDVTDFRTMFGLPQNFSTTNVILNGPDPGINGSEGESDLDVQWSGAVAPGARIDFVTSASTETTPGINLSALYIVDHNLDAVMSESFGACEKTLGTTFNQFFNSLWEQASAQGITVVVAAGDNGSAGCDDFTTEQTATQGLAVSGFASTPFNVAVGGTDFDQANRQSTFWDTTQTSTTTEPIPASAKSYIPEIPWNDSCGALGINGCNASNAQGIAAGSGGVSSLYTKPSWQTGNGVPADGHRDLPDVSLFAGNGLNGSFYIMCQKDVTTTSSCTLNNFNFSFQGVGGTSASAPAFAGIMALVNQKLASVSNPTPRQGNANYYLYALALQQNTANLSCNSSSSPVAGCSFNDVTKGNNDVPCTGASTNCSSGGAGVYGVLVTAASPTTPAYTTTAGYDLATGLGSLNAQNVVNKWSSVNTTATTTVLTLNNGSAVNVTHGQAVPYQISVAPSSAGGDASLIATPTGNPIGIGPFTLSGGAASGTTTQLPGGTSYSVVAHYEGNGTDAPSDSSPVAVTVAPESSKVFITVPTFDANTGQQTGNMPTTLVYGSPYILRADVTNASGSLSALCKPPVCPGGTITFTDTVGGVSQGAPNSGTFSLNGSGYTEDLPVQFPGGTNIITATYSGDGSFSASSQAATYTLNITQAPTEITVPYLPFSPVLAGVPMNVSSSAGSNITAGAAPGGTITFFDGATQMTGPVTVTSTPGSSGLHPSISTTLSATFTSPGTHSITAHYSGDGSYAASISSPTVASVFWPTSLTVTPAASTINYGQSLTLTATLTTTGKVPAITGTFLLNQTTKVTPTLSVDGSGNQTLTATFTVTPQSNAPILVNYVGDANYNGSFATASVFLIVPDFTLSPNPSSLAITLGQTLTSTVTITPAGTMSSTVALSCSTVFTYGLSCKVSPASVNLSNAAPVNATLTVAIDGTSVPSAAKATTKPKKSTIFMIGGPWWRAGGAGAGLSLLLILFFPYLRQRRYTFSAAVFSFAVLVVAIGCGGSSSSGSSSAGGGGGGVGTGPASTSVTLTLPGNKVAAGTSFKATASVKSTGTLTGTVTFWAVDNGGALGPSAQVVNGSATAELTIGPAGFYEVYATYDGDPANKSSQSAHQLLEVTGINQFISVTGTTGPLTHTASLPLTVQ